MNKVNGAIWICDQKKSKSPDFLGKIDLDGTLLDELLEEFKVNKKATLQVACWKAISNQGNAYLKVEATRLYESPAKKSKHTEITSGATLYD